jgi:hypothetical protein
MISSTRIDEGYRGSQATPAGASNSAPICSSGLPFVSGTSFQQKTRVGPPIAA